LPRHGHALRGRRRIHSVDEHKKKFTVTVGGKTVT
jgi:hypothetical protein